MIITHQQTGSYITLFDACVLLTVHHDRSALTVLAMVASMSYFPATRVVGGSSGTFRKWILNLVVKHID